MKKAKSKKKKTNLGFSKRSLDTQFLTRKGALPLRGSPLAKIGVFASNFNQVLLFLFIFLLPTQLGKHFFFPFSYLSGIRVDYLAPTLYLTDILVLLLLLLNYKTVFDFFKNKTLLTFLLFLLLPVGLALVPQIAIYRYIKIVELLIIFAIFSKTKLNIRAVFFGFFFSTLLQAFLVILQLVNKHSLQGIFYFLGERYATLSMSGIAKASLQGVELLRPYGTFSHPNSLAGFFLLVYALFLSSKTKTNPLIKNLLIFSSAFIVFLSFSKIAILTLILITVVYLVFSWRKINCKFCLWSRIIIFTFLGLIFISAQTDPNSIQKRVELLQNSLAVISTYPATGVGLGNYIVAQAKIAKQFFVLTQPVHNIFLLLISEVGIFLGSAIIIFLVAKFREHLKSLVIVSCILVIVSTGLFDHYWLTLQQNWLLLGVVFGLLINPASRW